jgi:hypothetical protein
VKRAIDDRVPPIYAVADHRHDGRPRFVGEYVDPQVAQAAADLLRAAGADARVELLSTIDAT